MYGYATLALGVSGGTRYTQTSIPARYSFALSQLVLVCVAPRKENKSGRTQLGELPICHCVFRYALGLKRAVV